LFNADSIGSLGSVGKNPRAIDGGFSVFAREVTPTLAIVANAAIVRFELTDPVGTIESIARSSPVVVVETVVRAGSISSLTSDGRGESQSSDGSTSASAFPSPDSH
jgi:hypothetical protein